MTDRWICFLKVNRNSVFINTRFVGVLLIALTGLITPAGAEDIRLIATGADKAIIEVDGQRLVLSDDNPSQSGVTLVSADSTQAVILINQQRLTLKSDDNSALVFDSTILPDENENLPVILWADSSGFFYADGTVNGGNVRFLVDTGANIVTFSSVHAEQLGIDYKKGRDGYASTASGIAPLKTLKVNSISISNITLYDVPISVVNGQFPQVPLLGGSFLNHLDMVREGNKMELKRR